MNIAEMIITEARERGLQHFFGIAAAYYGLMHDTAGLALSVKGVGAGNLVGGAVNAHFERVPLVCLSEQSPDSFTNKEYVQHCDHRGLFGAVTKYDNVLCPGTAVESVRNAVFQATDGRPGPALLNLPSEKRLMVTTTAGT